jgi:hypothetical protein
MSGRRSCSSGPVAYMQGYFFGAPELAKGSEEASEAKSV